MAATSTRNPAATKKAASPAGGSAAALTPIWIRLPRVGEPDVANDESLDGEATARSFSQARHDSATESARTPEGRRDRSAAGSRTAREPAVEAIDEDELPEEAPAYLRDVADRQRSASLASEAESNEEAIPERTGRARRRSSRSEGNASGGFFSHVLKAPYNVLAGIALVAVFVALYACFKPGTDAKDVIPGIEPGPSLSLDLGELSPPTEPYVSAPVAVDPSTLYPEPSLPADGGFRPADEFPPVIGVASAEYGAPASIPADPAVSPALGAASGGTAAMHASSKVTATVDPSLAGLPVESYPDTNPATYRYPADANFEVPSGVERTAEGATLAPRAASLGDTLEKTPVR